MENTTPYTNLLYKLNRIYCVYYENAKILMLLMYHALSGIYARFLYAAVHDSI